MSSSSEQDKDDALDAAVSGSQAMARMPGYERAALLHRIADSMTAKSEEIAQIMVRETGKAIADCRVEAQRAPATIRLCAEEAVRIEGEHVPMDASAMGAGKIAMTLRFPRGVVSAITPFNAPVNLAAHKLGPALASGNSVVLKPSPKAPLSVYAMMQAVLEADVPDGAVNLVYGDAIAPALVTDPRVDFVSFTGSIPVGKIIRNTAGMKGVALELGGVGPTFVHHDADIEQAAIACARHAMQLAGQSCASVQNVYVHASIEAEFTALMRAEIARIRFGDPLDENTEVGTLIDAQAAARVEAVISNAIAQGAELLDGGVRDGAQIQATVVRRATPQMSIMADEVFGPTVTVTAYDDIVPIVARINASPYGLQCGLFTNSLDLSLWMIRSMRTGGVIVNGTSRWRSDQMPYGGVKDSGAGREGPKFAMRDMTEERFFVFN